MKLGRMLYAKSIPTAHAPRAFAVYQFTQSPLRALRAGDGRAGLRHPEGTKVLHIWK